MNRTIEDAQLNLINSRGRLVHLNSPELPDAFFDISLFRMRLPEEVPQNATGSFRLSDLPSIQLRQQIAHECFHVLQSLQYSFFGNFTNYLWRRSEAIFEELDRPSECVNFTVGEGFRAFSERNGAAGLRIWSAIISQDRYDESQFREYSEHKPASLFSLVEAMAVSFQAISSATLPQTAFPELPSSYTRSHDFISGFTGKDFDMFDHYIFVTALDPILRATDFGDVNRSRYLGNLAKHWSKAKEIFLHLAHHTSADHSEFLDFILDICDDYTLQEWEVAEIVHHAKRLEVNQISLAAASMGVASFVNEEILKGQNQIPNRVRYTPLSEAIAKRVERTGWGEGVDFNVPLILCSPTLRDRLFNTILADTVNPISRPNDIAIVGDFALRTIELRTEGNSPCNFVDCIDHGHESWKDAIVCKSENSISASLARLKLPSVSELFVHE